MCLIVFAHEAHPDYSLILAANRDEFHARPTAGLAIWPDAPGVVGGRDLLSGGTWLAVGPEGRWGAVTNYRDPDEFERKGPSRGHLVADFVSGNDTPADYLSRLRPRDREFNGYNLLVGRPGEVWWTSNRAGGADAPRRLAPGLFGLSNHLLDTPWPKVARGKAALRKILAADEPPTPGHLLPFLLDRTYAAEHDLPATGVAADLERALSPAFIALPDYGTRASTALLIARTGSVLIAERRYGPGGETTGEDRVEM